jgi:hypothetical protein
MKRRVVEVMFAARCPQLHELVERVQAAIRARVGSRDDVVEIRLVQVATMSEACERRFLGTPTVRVDGRDVEPNLTSTMFGLHNRGYFVDGRVERMPPRDWIQELL